MQREDPELIARLNRARSTVDQIERLCARSAQLTARAELLLGELRQHSAEYRTLSSPR